MTLQSPPHSPRPSLLHTIKRTLVVLPIALLAVCSHADSSGYTPAIGGKDTTPVEAARHTYFAPQVEREIGEMVRYPLSMDKIERFARATDNLTSLTAGSSSPAHTAVPTPRDLEQNGGLMGYAAAEYEWDPKQRHAIERAGLRAWEYVTIIFVLANTHDQYMRYAGGLTSRSSPLVSASNLAFFSEHRLEIERLVPNLWGPSSTSAGEVR
ncbi:MAG: hypothetical protein M3081_10120 [Gemmatimonadota bacterium]|nr:hypothetical protein [Gemmatimonadota bacterium]